MKNDGPEWFAPKRFGYGAGLPISWQGWALSIGFLVASLLIATKLSARPAQAIGAFVPLVAGFVVIVWKTTRGGWRWRWGDED